jgi:DNA-binding ferritin-like protein
MATKSESGTSVRKEIAEGLSGPMFRDLHLMFEEQYTELAGAVDEIAERIRALGQYAPATR